MTHTNLTAAVSAALLLASAGPVTALSSDQESACGAILCLVGGSGVAECTGYLTRYFAITAKTPQEQYDRRLDFLNLCPASDLPADIRPLIVTYGAQCQPSTLVNHLNAQIQWCEAHNLDGSADCKPRGDEWQGCAPFYDHAYTAYEAPRVDERCRRVTDTDGYQRQRCTYAWVEADAPPLPAESTTPTGYALPSN